MFRVKREEIVPRPDGDILPGLASKETFINAIMSHELHGPWFGAARESQGRPAIHHAISTFNEKRKELFYSSEGNMSASEAWDAAVAEMDDRLMFFLHGWYGKDQFSFAKCGSKLNFYSTDSTTNRLLFDNKLVPSDLSDLYDEAIDSLTEAVSSSEGTLLYNDFISQHLKTLMKKEYWLNDSPSRFGTRSTCVRGSWMYALVLKNYPNYISNNVNNLGSTDQTGGGSWWPTNFGKFSIGNVVNSWWNQLTGQQTLKLEIPSSATNMKTDPRGKKRASETQNENQDEENLFGNSRPEQNNPPTKRRRTSAGFVATTHSTSGSASTSISTSRVPTSVSIKPKKLLDAPSMDIEDDDEEDDDMSETTEMYSDFWDSKEKNTTTSPKKKTTAGRVSHRTRSKRTTRTTRTTPSTGRTRTTRTTRSTPHPNRRPGCEHMSNTEYRQHIHKELKKKNCSK